MHQLLYVFVVCFAPALTKVVKYHHVLENHIAIGENHIHVQTPDDELKIIMMKPLYDNLPIQAVHDQSVGRSSRMMKNVGQVQLARVISHDNVTALVHYSIKTGLQAIIYHPHGRMFIEPSCIFLDKSQSCRDAIFYHEKHIVVDESKCKAKIPPHLKHPSIEEQDQFQHKTAGYNKWGDLASSSSSSASSSSASRKRGVKDGPANDVCSSSCTCPVALIGDQYFYKHMNEDMDAAIARMVMLLTDVDAIYSSTDFEGTSGYGLTVAIAKIFTSSQSPGNPVPNSAYDSESFLEAFSTTVYSSYCLVHMFTHREFSDGLLGLAWVGSSRGAGICDTTGYNAGFSTSLNYGSTVSLGVTTITLAHEIGHNYGSDHDPQTTECAPGGSSGNYIMYASATSGDLPYNNRFSPCSRQQMASIINAKKSSCFTNDKAICGNGIVEGDEICDCGQECDADPCCDDKCQVKQGQDCSPQNPLRFPCCTPTCKFATGNSTVECAKGSECTLASYCTGDAATCPTSESKSDGTLCSCQDNDCKQFPDTASKVCTEGKCQGSLCSLYDAEQCALPGPKACQLGCQGPGWGNGDECVSTYDYANISVPINLASGTPCDDYNGYCSQNGLCKTVRSNDILEDIKNFFNNITKEQVVKWLQDNWMYLLAGIAGVVLIIVGLKYTYRLKREDEVDFESLPLLEKEQKLDAECYYEDLSLSDAKHILKSAREGSFLFVKGRKKTIHLVFVSLSGIASIQFESKLDDQLRTYDLDNGPDGLAFPSIKEIVRTFSCENQYIECLRYPVLFGDLHGRRELWRP